MSSGALPDRDIFTEEGSRAFLAYLNEPAPWAAATGITRYLAQLQESRPDLQQAFPDLDGPDGSRLTAWAQVSGAPPGRCRRRCCRSVPATRRTPGTWCRA